MEFETRFVMVKVLTIYSLKMDFLALILIEIWGGSTELPKILDSAPLRPSPQKQDNYVIHFTMGFFGLKKEVNL